jgi:hypothetical protein
MKAFTNVLVSLAVVPALVAGGTVRQPALAAQQMQQQAPNVAIVWASGDREVALNMVFMYALNAKTRGWANQVELIVWGPSSKLLSHDLELQQQVAVMREAGVVLKACKACADSYGVSEKLQELGVEVKYMGVELTELIASPDWHTITF